MATPAVTLPTVGWYHVRNGQITSIRVFFDPRPVAPALGQGGPVAAPGDG